MGRIRNSFEQVVMVCREAALLAIRAALGSKESQAKPGRAVCRGVLRSFKDKPVHQSLCVQVFAYATCGFCASVRIYVHMLHMYTYIYTYTHVLACVCVCPCIYVKVYISAHVCVYVYT